jgi:DNA invertase Pin-like site-specific DNA recombinase
MATRCAIWARVSKDEQESGNQLAELRQLAATRGFGVTAEYVLDGASAWKGERREQLCQALNSARREYDVLLVLGTRSALPRGSRNDTRTVAPIPRKRRHGLVT